VLGGGADVERAIVSALEERLAASNDSSGNDLVLLQLAYVAANIAEGRKIIERHHADDKTSYSIKEPLARALALEKLDVAHDFDEPIALELQLGMEGYSEDSRPHNHLTLGVRNAAVTWESSGTGYVMGMFGVLDGTDSRGGFRFTGELRCTTPEAARARAREELRAATLLGYRKPAPKKPAKKKK
jgi:hypothetical protein